MTDPNHYRYDDFAKVPEAGFNARAANSVKSWTIPANSGATFTVMFDGKSDATVIYRAVPVSAP